MFEVFNHQVSELHLIIDNGVWIALVANMCWYRCRYCGKMNNAMWTVSVYVRQLNAHATLNYFEDFEDSHVVMHTLNPVNSWFQSMTVVADYTLKLSPMITIFWCLWM